MPIPEDIVPGEIIEALEREGYVIVKKTLLMEFDAKAKKIEQMVAAQHEVHDQICRELDKMKPVIAEYVRVYGPPAKGHA